MKYFKLTPEVPGELGNNSTLDQSSHPPKVAHLHVVFEGWEGDALLEIFPCFMVTEALHKAIVDAELTGCSFSDFEFEFDADSPSAMQAERFVRLLPSARPAEDDLASDANGYLVVSERALAILKRFRLSACEVSEFA